MVLILALIAWGTPLLVIHFSEQWLKDQGVPEPHIASLSLNPFTGYARVEGVDFSGDDIPGRIGRVELNLEWLALLRG